MGKSTQRAPRAARSTKPVIAVEEAAPDGPVRIYPTHRRQAAPLVVALPSVEGNSDELVIDDEGLEVSAELAAQLIAAREATTEAPAPAEE